MALIFFVLIFGLVVVSHEFGHFLIAKMNGIHVVEFAVGMGPNLIFFTKGETKYSLKLLPIGGACVFEGEDGLNIQEGETSEGSFMNANVWARIATVVAGPVFNFILGFIASIILVSLVVINLPVIRPMENGPALEAGLQENDKILSLNGENISEQLKEGPCHGSEKNLLCPEAWETILGGGEGALVRFNII